MWTSTSQHGDGGYAGDRIAEVIERESPLAAPKKPGEAPAVKKQVAVVQRQKQMQRSSYRKEACKASDSFHDGLEDFQSVLTAFTRYRYFFRFYCGSVMYSKYIHNSTASMLDSLLPPDSRCKCLYLI